MTERIWFNGRVIPFSEAHISVEDRGFQFADGIYEVIRLYGGRPFALPQHLTRLDRSAEGIQLQLPVRGGALAEEILSYLTTVGAGEGMIYLQATRGAGARNHLFPPHSGQKPLEPTVLFYFRAMPALPGVEQTPGVKLHAVPDERWQRCWIKSIALLPNVLAKNTAAAAGADEAVFLDNDVVTECSASNLFGVINSQLVTHPVGAKVLPGITRAVVLELAGNMGIAVQERMWKSAEAIGAEELFILSTTREINWVKSWNERTVGGGRLGAVTRKLAEGLREFVLRETRAG